MAAAKAWTFAAATDPGLHRDCNEDRTYVDPERGVFLVVDGMGGHAAGEVAAETAVDVIRREISQPGCHADTAALVRSAITKANNTIYAAAQKDPRQRGMACVLTMAVFDKDRITVGHVGDTRMYLLWNGSVRKITTDHSPVGLQEENGELTEQEAMLHPRRNEVFRNVGSRHRTALEPQFIELRELPFRPDAGIVLCSDGLSSCVESREIGEICGRYEGDAERVARELVETAVASGTTDNVSVIFVAGSRFGPRRREVTRARTRTAGPRRLASRVPHLLFGKAAFLIYGLTLGLLIAASWT